jgi:hypothetical protein
MNGFKELICIVTAYDVTGTCSVATLVISDLATGLSRSFKHTHCHKKVMFPPSIMWHKNVELHANHSSRLSGCHADHNRRCRRITPITLFAVMLSAISNGHMINWQHVNYLREMVQLAERKENWFLHCGRENNMMDTSHWLKFEESKVLSCWHLYSIVVISAELIMAWSMQQDGEKFCMAMFSVLSQVHIAHTVCTTEKCYLGW